MIRVDTTALLERTFRFELEEELAHLERALQEMARRPFLIRDGEDDALTVKVVELRKQLEGLGA